MVFGELHSTYTISLELVNKNYSDLTVGNSVDEYLLPRHKYVFHLKFKDESGVLNFNQYMYKLSTFRGRLLANFFYDEHLVRIYPHHSYQLMGDEEFLFTRD